MQKYGDDSCIARWHVTVHNHLRALLWRWYTRKGVHFEDEQGRRRFARDEDAWSIVEKQPSVRKALSRSNNAEEFQLFVVWVAGCVEGQTAWAKRSSAASAEVVNLLMNAKSPKSAIALVWKHGMRRAQPLLQHLEVCGRQKLRHRRTPTGAGGGVGVARTRPRGPGAPERIKLSTIPACAFACSATRAGPMTGRSGRRTYGDSSRR